MVSRSHPPPAEVTHTETTSRVQKLLQIFPSEEFGADTEVRKNSLQALSYEEFKKRLLSVNGILQGVEPSEHDFYKGLVPIGMGEHRIYLPPDMNDRETLLAGALDAAKRVDDIQDAALILGTAIVLIHPFNEANVPAALFTMH